MLTAIGLGVVIVGILIISNVWKTPHYKVILAWDPEAMPADWEAAVVPGASTHLLPWLGGWMNANNRWIQVVLGLGFGIWLLVKGVNGL